VTREGAEEERLVDSTDALEKWAAGDDAAEGGTGGGGAAEVGQHGEADQDVREEVVSEPAQRRRWLVGLVRFWPLRLGHCEQGWPRAVRSLWTAEFRVSNSQLVGGVGAWPFRDWKWPPALFFYFAVLNLPMLSHLKK
jgi:hypothetical protein